MNLAEMRKRLGDIQAKLQEYAAVENFSNEDIEVINGLNAEFESLKGQIEAREKVEATLAAAATSTRKTEVAPVVTAAPVASNKKFGGFQSNGEFFLAASKASQGNVDKRFQNTMYEKNGEDGGYLVPEEFQTQILKKIEGDESLLARTNQIRVGSNNLTLPVDETAPWSGVGVQGYWVAEGAPITSSGAKLSEVSWKMHKVAAMVPVTNELLDDAVALESYLGMVAPAAIMHKINEAIISGNGVGKPQGFLNSPFKIKVSKEGGQTADTIVARNVVKMYNAMIPSALGGAVWIATPQVKDQLRLMKDDNDNFIYLAAGSSLNNSPFDTLMGRPVVYLLGGVKALGDEGDLSFVNLSYYWSVLKSAGIASAVSTHLYFDSDKTAFRFTMRLDGKAPFSAPITTQYGNYSMSAFVTLEDR